MCKLEKIVLFVLKFGSFFYNFYGTGNKIYKDGNTYYTHVLAFIVLTVQCPYMTSNYIHEY